MIESIHDVNSRVDQLIVKERSTNMKFNRQVLAVPMALPTPGSVRQSGKKAPTEPETCSVRQSEKEATTKPETWEESYIEAAEAEHVQLGSKTTMDTGAHQEIAVTESFGTVTAGTTVVEISRVDVIANNSETGAHILEIMAFGAPSAKPGLQIEEIEKHCHEAEQEDNGGTEQEYIGETEQEDISETEQERNAEPTQVSGDDEEGLPPQTEESAFADDKPGAVPLTSKRSRRKAAK